MRTNSMVGASLLMGSVACVACATNDGGNLALTNPSNRGADGGTGGSRGIGPVIDNPTPNNAIDMSGKPATKGCGNGELTEDEACDDGNRESGDGCLNNCLQVELGFSCVPAGQPCHRIARCGDQVLVFPELCDDGNREDGDGCSSTCKIEIGFKCEGTPSECSPTTCGDGIVEGAESCEDGNTLPFDGCSSDCQHEPALSGSFSTVAVPCRLVRASCGTVS